MYRGIINHKLFYDPDFVRSRGKGGNHYLSPKQTTSNTHQFLVHLKAICRVPVVLRNNYNNNKYSLSCGTYIFFPNLVILST